MDQLSYVWEYPLPETSLLSSNQALSLMYQGFHSSCWYKDGWDNSNDFLQSSRITIRTYTAPRSDSYRAGLKNRSGPWCNPVRVLSAQTFVVSDKHSSIQKTICHSLLSFSNFAFVFSNALPCVELLFLQKLLLINICHLLQEAVMTSILRECPNAVNISLWLHILRYLGLPSVLLWRHHTESSNSRKFYALFDILSN